MTPGMTNRPRRSRTAAPRGSGALAGWTRTIVAPSTRIVIAGRGGDPVPSMTVTLVSATPAVCAAAGAAPARIPAAAMPKSFNECWAGRLRTVVLAFARVWNTECHGELHGQ